jgi:hypothetical protein
MSATVRTLIVVPILSCPFAKRTVNPSVIAHIYMFSDTALHLFVTVAYRALIADAMAPCSFADRTCNVVVVPFIEHLCQTFRYGPITTTVRAVLTMSVTTAVAQRAFHHSGRKTELVTNSSQSTQALFDTHFLNCPVPFDRKRV